MVDVSHEVTELLERKECGVYEIAGLPEAGTTTAAEVLLGNHVIASPFTSIDAICFSKENAPDQGYIKSIISEEASGHVILGFYSRENTEELLMLISGLADACDAIVIDDFYNVLLYRKYTFIRSFMKSLKNIASAYGTKIFFVNQYRHVIKNDSYLFDVDEEYKTLYWEHLCQYVDGRITVSKDEEGNISMVLKELKKRGQKTSLENLLDQLE